MNIKEIILNKLLEKYEKSKSYTENVNRRILLKMSQIKEYNIEDYEKRQLWNSICVDLKNKGLINFDWEKFEENNILKSIWLIKDNIEEVYKEANRLNPKEGYKVILRQCENINFSQEWLQHFLEDIKNYMLERQKESTLLPLEKSKDILVALSEIDTMLAKNKNSVTLKRIFSIKCYNDSKYFERNIEKNIIRILKKYLNLAELKDDEILAEIGITKYPEIIEFCGNINCIINGKVVQYLSFTEGSYINSSAISKIESIEFDSKIKKVIFIENKANYIDYIRDIREDELVIYHGGFYSPIKGEFFRKIYKSKHNRDVEYFHWSDIDIGGFQIFTRLKENIIPDLIPFKMDIETLKQYINSANSFDETYRDSLEKLMNDKRYELFWDVINFMLENNVKLEQEGIIISRL